MNVVGDLCYITRFRFGAIEYWPGYGVVCPNLVTTNGSWSKLKEVLLGLGIDDEIIAEIEEWTSLVIKMTKNYSTLVEPS